MDYYTVLSSDLYQLSCIAVSQLAPYGSDELKGSDRFLVSEKLSGDQQQTTKTGYMSKFVTFDGIKEAIVEAIGYDQVSSDVANLSNEYVRKSDFGYKTISVDTEIVPNPYIISSIYFSGGKPISADGYRLVSALADTVICVYFKSLSSHELVADDMQVSALTVRMLSASEISSPFTDYINSIIPDGASHQNKLADQAYVSATVVSNASTFRGCIPPSTLWQDLSSVDIYLPDEHGNRTPNIRDYMSISASTYNNAHPSSRIDDGTWRFSYCGEWQRDRQDGWKPEYRIETTPLTPAQNSALNSGVTSKNFIRPANSTTPSQTGDPNTPVFVWVNDDGFSFVRQCNPFFPLSGVSELRDDITDDVIDTVSSNIPVATTQNIGGFRVASPGELTNAIPVKIDADTAIAYIDAPTYGSYTGQGGISVDNINNTIQVDPSDIETWTFTLRDDSGNITTETKKVVVVH